jgi:hypothetical protein
MSPPSPLAAAAMAGVEDEPPPARRLGAGALAAGVLAASVLAGAAFTAPFFIVPWLPRRLYGALPYMATSPRRLEALLSALPPAYTVPGRRFIDLGSGDGVAVLAAARRGMLADGVELNPSLVFIARWRARAGGYMGLPRAEADEVPGAGGGGVQGRAAARGLGSPMAWPGAEVEGGATQWATPPPLAGSGGGGGGGSGAVSPLGAGSARVWLGNLFDVSLRPYDVIMVFGVVPIMGR